MNGFVVFREGRAESARRQGLVAQLERYRDLDALVEELLDAFDEDEGSMAERGQRVERAIEGMRRLRKIGDGE